MLGKATKSQWLVGTWVHVHWRKLLHVKSVVVPMPSMSQLSDMALFRLKAEFRLVNNQKHHSWDQCKSALKFLDICIGGVWSEIYLNNFSFYISTTSPPLIVLACDWHHILIYFFKQPLDSLPLLTPPLSLHLLCFRL